LDLDVSQQIGLSLSPLLSSLLDCSGVKNQRAPATGGKLGFGPISPLPKTAEIPALRHGHRNPRHWSLFNHPGGGRHRRPRSWPMEPASEARFPGSSTAGYWRRNSNWESPSLNRGAGNTTNGHIDLGGLGRAGPPAKRGPRVFPNGAWLSRPQTRTFPTGPRHTAGGTIARGGPFRG